MKRVIDIVEEIVRISALSMATGLDATGFYSRDKLADPAVIAKGKQRLDYHEQYVDECDAKDGVGASALQNAETADQSKLADVEVLRRQTRNTLNGKG